MEEEAAPPAWAAWEDAGGDEKCYENPRRKEPQGAQRNARKKPEYVELYFSRIYSVLSRLTVKGKAGSALK